MAAYLTPEQLDRAIELQRKCWTQDRIAAELGVHRMTVSRGLSKYNRQVAARMEKRAVAAKGRQIAQLEWVAEQAAEAFPLAFDAALLNQVRGALADIRKIVGMDAHAKAQPQGDANPPADLGGIAASAVEQVEGMSKRANGGDG